MRIKDMVYIFRMVGGEKLKWHGRYHAHGFDEYEIHYFIEGKGIFLSNEARITLHPGLLTLTRPCEFHSILPEEVSLPITYYAILFEAEDDDPEDRAALRLLDKAATGMVTRSCPNLEPRDRFLFDELHRLSRAERPSEKKAESFLLLSQLYRWYGDIAESGQVKPPRNERIEKAVTLMARLLKDKVGMDRIASKLGLSEEHFIRVFKAEIGMTPFQFYTRLKIEAACGQLVSSTLSIGRIAEEFAFENQFHFARVFKKCTGLSPTDYRKTYLQV
jgi:AraC-like DNA-binding protein